ncbi:MAG: ankyrin repeat domain-containing protein [Capsulimonas sp.]|uniref:ankyrin repeat domain-containing protein n=1 Tax=Capsulimonas sp. TaxID=2494211 RepID=UPI0032656B4B
MSRSSVFVKPILSLLVPITLFGVVPAVHGQGNDAAATVTAEQANPNVSLWNAVHTGNVAAAKAALDAGAGPNWSRGPEPNQELMNLPVLIEALNRQDTPMVTLLITHGADINTRTSSSYPLLAALGPKAPLALVKVLLDGKANTEAKGNDQTTPLAHFCSYGRMDVVKLLLAHHANIESRDSFGMTPVLTAISAGNLPLVKFLIAQGANLFQTTDNRSTALHIASINPKNAPILRYLMQRGFEVNLKDGDGLTPLHVAVNYGSLENVKFLLAHGADIHTRAKDGKTLIAGVYDNEQNSPELVKNAKAIIAVLKAAGAKS